MSDARTKFLIEEAIQPLLERIAALSAEVSSLHTELHNAVSKQSPAPTRRTNKD